MAGDTTTERVRGACAPGFESMRDSFARYVPLERTGAALAVYVGGELTVDLYGGDARPGQAWAPDTRAVMFSATKGMATVCVQILHDRGLLDIEAPVAEVWPGFGVNGKAGITTRMIMNHTAGLVELPRHDEVISRAWDGAGFDRLDAIAERLQTATPVWEPGTAHGYHAFTYGWLVGEIVRRVDGRTLGAFLRDEVTGPLGADLAIGTSPEDQPRVAFVDGNRVPRELVPEAMLPLYDAIRDPSTTLGKAFLAGSDGDMAMSNIHEMMRLPRMLAAEFASGNGTATAPGLARVYAALAAGGTLDGVRLVSPEIVADYARLQPPGGTDVVLTIDMNWMTGYHGQVAAATMATGSFSPSDTAFGHGGYGGQRGFADPAHGIGFAYVQRFCETAESPALSLASDLYGLVG